jgi:nucleotide-binding universal stress UspA family protein
VKGQVLFCFDGSEEAAQAIRDAAALLAECEMLVLSVAVPAEDAFPLDPIGDLVGRLSTIYRDWDEIAAAVAERHARRGAEIATEAGLSARALTASGKPAPTILRMADEHDVTVIVLAKRRHIAHWSLLGSVSARVVHDASRPVLLIPGG